MTRTRRHDRIARLALAFVVAFVMVAGMTAVASAVVPATAHAAAPLTICTAVDEVPVTLQDGTSRCVENTCEAILGAEGRASECTSESTALDNAVPAAGETGSGVAPVPARSAAAAEPEPEPATQATPDRSTLATLAWIFGAIGSIALLVALGLVATGRVRLRRDRRAATRTSA